MGGLHLLQQDWGRRLMNANLMASLASNLCSFVLPWEVLQRTGHAGWAASSVGFSYMGQVLFSIPLGSWADRHHRQRVLHGLLALCLLPISVFAAILLFTENETWLWGMLIAQACIMVLTSAINSTAGAAAQQHDKENTTASVAALVNSRQVSWFAGQGLGAWLVALGGALAAPLAAGGMILFALIYSWQLPHWPRPEGHPPLHKKIREILRLPDLWPITLLGSGWNLAAGALTSSLVPWMSLHGLDSAEMGWVYLCGAGGALAAGMVLHRITAHRPERYLAPGLFLWSAAVGLYAMSGQQMILILILWGLVMMVNTSLAGLVAGLRAESIPARLMIAGSQTTMLVRISCFTLGGLGAGWIADRWGIGAVPLVCAAWTLLLILPGWWVGRLLDSSPA